jgi:DUF1680 family protein
LERRQPVIDYYERNLMNHRLGAIEPVDRAHHLLFCRCRPGRGRRPAPRTTAFWCCTGTGVEEFSKLNDTIYSHDDDSLFVNLYFASTVNWKQRGVRLKQETNIPRERANGILTIEKTPARHGRSACAFPRGRRPKIPSPSMASGWKRPELREAI